MHLGPDKNPNHIRTEVAFKRLRTVLSDRLRAHRWSVDRERGAIKAGWTNIIKLKANPGGEPFEVAYKYEGIIEVQLTRVEVSRIVAEATAPPSPTRWSL